MSPNNNQLIDKEELFEQFEDFDEVLLKLINGVLEQYPTQIQEIKEAAVAQDLEKLAFVSHSLKGLISNVLAEALVDQLNHIEESAREKRSEDLSDTISEVEGNLKKMHTELEEVLQQLSQK